MLELPAAISIKGRDGKLHDDVPMWTFWSLQEGTLGVDPKLQRTNDGKMPPVIHVDTDATLYSDVDRSTDHRHALGHLLQARFQFRRHPGRRHAVQGQGRSGRGEDRSLRAGIAGLRRRRRFRPYVVLGAGLLPEALRGQDTALQEGALGRHRQLHRRQLSGVRPVLRERLCHRGFQPRLQDDRRRRAGGRGHLRPGRASCSSRSASRALPRASCIRRPTARSRGARGQRTQPRLASAQRQGTTTTTRLKNRGSP